MGASLALGETPVCLPFYLDFFFSFWCVRTWGVSPVQVLSTPSLFSDLRRLPRFYRALLSAWSSAGGSFLPSRGALSVGSGLTVAPASSLTTKSAYSLLLIDRYVVPHCAEKFFVPFGQLYWSSTWRQLFFFDIDRPVIDLSWKIANSVLYTAEWLASFAYFLKTWFHFCLYLVVGSLPCCLALSFHPIARHQFGGESPGLVFLCVCFSSSRAF